ncbi:hypothetical protein HYT55_05500 [Candidatus Woesearchaeota archaeon]|nr:hypothetical protein [Candidatus Woesearchaeota archaeon]
MIRLLKKKETIREEQVATLEKILQQRDITEVTTDPETGREIEKRVGYKEFLHYLLRADLACTYTEDGALLVYPFQSRYVQ